MDKLPILFLFWIIPVTGWSSHQDSCSNEIKVESISVSSTKSGYNKEHIIDDDDETYWESDGYYEWIELDLGDQYPIGSLEISFPKERRERYIFLIQLSTDNKRWASVRMAQANPYIPHRQQFNFTDYRARYIRIQSKGNTTHHKNRFAEIRVMGGSCNAPKPLLEKDENPFDELVPEIVSNIITPVFPDRVCSITDYGAKSGDSDSLEEIKTAIQDCHRRGGGTVLVPRGDFYVAGSVQFESNIQLHLEEGARLSFSTNPEDFLPMVYSNWEGSELLNYSPMIYAYNKENIAITGKGRIDGRASDSNWWKWKNKQDDDVQLLRSYTHQSVPVADRKFGDGHFLRPPLIQLVRSENILIEDVELRGSPFWFVNPVGSP